MEQVSEKLTNYDSSRTRRSLAEDCEGGDSDDKEYATSGFYVREKSNDKQSRSNSLSNSNDATETDKDDNLVESKTDANLANGEASEEDKLDESEKKEEEDEVIDESNIAETEKKNDTDVNEENNEATTEDVVNEATTEEVAVNEATTEEDDKTETELQDNAEVIDETDKKDEEEGKVEEVSIEIDKDKTEEKEAETAKDVEQVDDKQEEVATNNATKTDKETPLEVTVQKEEESASESEKKEEAKLAVIVDEEKSSKDEENKSEDKEDEPMPLNDKNEVEPVKENENKKEQVEENESKNDEPSKEIEDKKEQVVENEIEQAKEIEDEKDQASDTDKNLLDKKKDENPKEVDPLYSKHSSSTNTGTDYEDEDDFDPSLLCPDISMDIDEAPVVTNSQPVPPPREGSVSPLPYEPIFSTLVDEYTGTEIQVDLTPEEMELRQNMYKPSNPVQSTKIHCTACNVHLGSALTGANNRFVHPLLKVLICKNCYHFYTSGEFEKDEDGSELYCRWCGQGGQVLCCSSCEFVFCKRCIRNNFGPKKFKQIRESDDWNCFRCEPGQLSYLRAACAEFIDYYKKESLRAQALAGTNPELLTTDYTKCCSKEKVEEPKPLAQRPKRRRNNNEDSDPDYVNEVGEPSSKRQALSNSGLPSTLSQLRNLAPKPGTAASIIAPMPPKLAIRPQVGPRMDPIRNRQLGNNAIRNVPPGFVARPGTSAGTPGYVKLMQQPRGPRPAAPLQQVRPSSSFTVVSGTSNGRPTFTSVRPTKVASQMPPMKHEWFEKTVRAAARVNSNLSYTLTQLNRQQSQATSVESLAVVHNKLQEVLSTSINSLIQVRKNLRTEFLVGIKSVKLPSKTPKPTPAPPPPPPKPAATADDDDVIFVSQPPPLVMSPSISMSNLNRKVPPKVAVNNNFNNKASIAKSSPATKPTPSTSTNVAKSSPSISGTQISTTPKPPIPAANIGGPVKGGGFLKVRSLMALQSVPSECITIPDDPIEDPLRLIMLPQQTDQIEILDDEPERDEPPAISMSSPPPLAKLSMPSPPLDLMMTYNVKEKPSREVRKMMKAHVPLVKSANLEQLLEKDKLLHKEDGEKVARKRTGANS